jgi:RNA polymerase sigma-70 factor (sigma-E family)
MNAAAHLTDRRVMNRKHESEFEAFVAATGRSLLRTAYLLTGDRGHAEDLVQITLERTARRWHRLDGAPHAYARVVLTNLANDRWRRRRARVTETFPGADLDGVAHEDISNQFALRHALIDGLRKLPNRQRAVLVLRFFEDMSEAETAAALQISVGTVKSAASRGAARLRELCPELSERHFTSKGSNTHD